jgi:hypothetical protein
MPFAYAEMFLSALQGRGLPATQWKKARATATFIQQVRRTALFSYQRNI